MNILVAELPQVAEVATEVHGTYSPIITVLKTTYETLECHNMARSTIPIG